MKKFLSLLLAIVISLSCMAFVTSAVSADEKGSLLPNVYAKMKNGEDITVAYFGGSVTEGMGQSSSGNCWRDLSCNWMNENYGVPNGVKFEQKRYGPLGGTGTDLNVYRVNYALMYDTETPADLLFIEYAINDFYEVLDYDASAYYLESIIRNVRENNPTCDIVVCITTDFSRRDTDYSNAKAHAEVAAYYGIPVVWMGKQLWNDIVAENGGVAPSSYYDSVWKKYFLDNVHPIDAGYQKYFEYLRDDILKPNLDDNKSFSTKVTEYKLPEKLFKDTFKSYSPYYNKDLLTDAYMVTVGELSEDEISQNAPDYKLSGSELSTKTDGAVLRVKYNAKNGGLFYIMNTQSGGFKYSVDGKEYVKVDLYDSRSIAYYYTMFFEEETAGEHIVDIIFEETKPGTNFRIKGFFLSGDEQNNGVKLLPQGEERKEYTAFIKGYDDGTFRPGGTMTRAEAVTIVARLCAGGDALVPTDKKTAFTDVASHWGKNYISYVESLGYLKSYSGAFLPDQSITRAEFVELVYNMGLLKDAGKPSVFTDVASTHPRYNVITASAKAGLVNGYDNGDGTFSFKPDNTITRAEVVTVVNRALGNEANIEYLPSDLQMSFSDIDKSHWAYANVAEATVTHAKRGNEWINEEELEEETEPEVNYAPLIVRTQAEGNLYQEARKLTVEEMTDEETGIVYAHLTLNSEATSLALDSYSNPRWDISSGKAYYKFLIRTNDKTPKKIKISTYHANDKDGNPIVNSLGPAGDAYSKETVTADGKWQQIIVAHENIPEQAVNTNHIIISLSGGVAIKSFFDANGKPLQEDFYYDVAAWAAFDNLEAAQKFDMMETVK